MSLKNITQIPITEVPLVASMGTGSVQFTGTFYKVGKTVMVVIPPFIFPSQGGGQLQFITIEGEIPTDYNAFFPIGVQNIVCGTTYYGTPSSLSSCFLQVTPNNFLEFYTSSGQNFPSGQITFPLGCTFTYLGNQND